MKVETPINERSCILAAVALLALAQFGMAQSDKHLSNAESVKAAIVRPLPAYPELARQLKLRAMRHEGLRFGGRYG
jgi:hypothetical protein